MGAIYQLEHEVAYYECDLNQNMTFPAVVSIAIKASTEQSDQLERGSDYVEKLGLTWIITQYEMTIQRLPKVEENIKIFTEPTEYNRFFCYRDFWFEDQEGNELLRITAAFALMGIENRKVSSVNEELMAPYDSPKVKKIRRWRKIESVKDGEKKDYHVRFYDLDSNHHVNNAVYFNWIIDVLGYYFLTTYQPKEVSIRYDKEVSYGNEIESWSQVKRAEDILTCHEIRLGDQLCCEANIKWKQKD